MRSLILLATLLVLALVALAALPRPADAHALLLRSDPPQGARLLDPPRQVTAWFSEPLEPGVSRLRVLDGSGGQVDTGQVEFDPSDSTKMSVPLRDDFGPGFYLVTWETLSRVDGHLRFGSFEFVVLNPDGSEPAGARPSAVAGGTGSRGDEAPSAVTKMAGLVGAVTLVGSLGFLLFVTWPASREVPEPEGARARQASRRHLAWLGLPSLALLAIVAVAELALQARQIGGADQIATALDTSWGERWIERQVALAALAGALTVYVWLQRRRPVVSSIALWSALAAGLGYLLLVALVSHAGAVLRGSFWATASDFVHLAAAAVWIGGLVQLGLLLVWSRHGLPDQERPRFLATSVQRFSLVAVTSLVALLATGAFNALVQVSSPDELIETAYGRALTAKLALLVPLLAVAGLNAFILRPQMVRRAWAGESIEPLRRLLSRMVRLEAALGLAVLVVVGVLVQYTPARTEAEAAASARAQAAAQPFEGSVETAQSINVTLEVAPNTVGTNTFQVNVSPAPGVELREVERVTLRLQSPDASDQEQVVEAEPSGPSTYKAVGSFLTHPGRWTVRVDVERPDLADVSAAFRLGVQGAAEAGERGSFAFPLVVGNWGNLAALGLVVAGLLFWVWSGHLPVELRRVRRAGAAVAFALPVAGVALVLAVNLIAPSGGVAFEGKVAFRYQTQDGRFVLLEIDPFQVGQNVFKVTMLDDQEQPVEANTVDLRFSRLDEEGVSAEVAARLAVDGLSYLARYELAQTGWWAIDVVRDGSQAASFYLRLDDPSLAPLTFAPPDYEPDPRAEALFRETLERYEGLTSVKWREELTSGLLAPTGIGAWVVTDGEAEAPDKVHLSTLSPGFSNYELYRVGEKSCVKDSGASWQCSTGEAEEAFDLAYMEPSTAFRLGRREMVDGEMSQVLLFYNPSQGAWYTWWVGEETGYLRRQAMVAPGHFMLIQFFHHDQPLAIEIPQEALASGD